MCINNTLQNQLGGAPPCILVYFIFLKIKFIEVAGFRDKLGLRIIHIVTVVTLKCDT